MNKLATTSRNPKTRSVKQGQQSGKPAPARATAMLLLAVVMFLLASWRAVSLDSSGDPPVLQQAAIPAVGIAGYVDTAAKAYLDGASAHGHGDRVVRPPHAEVNISLCKCGRPTIWLSVLQEFHPLISIPVIVFSVPMDAQLVTSAQTGQYCEPLQYPPPGGVRQLSVEDDASQNLRFITCALNVPGIGVGSGDYAEAGVRVGLVARHTELSYTDGYHAAQVNFDGRLPASPKAPRKGLDLEPWLSVPDNHLDLTVTGFRGDMTRIYPRDAGPDSASQVSEQLTSEAAEQGRPANIYVAWRSHPSRWSEPVAAILGLIATGAIFGFSQEFETAADTYARKIAVWLIPIAGLIGIVLMASLAASQQTRTLCVCLIDALTFIAVWMILRWHTSSEA